ncbi:hypothetical protein PVAR5_8843 [Paecilomyces variotii No. 5]|uniref:Uncharacterized protein n=1 Tax=Byssochlamys spectabilis (strain No. 5 / NBRC 109023) TaxID=1356009 RepID=V5GGP0_BYSSN|nr:hypothetical protein PVAR5_8843 [Paecilomyces variotii No. 5]
MVDNHRREAIYGVAHGRPYGDSMARRRLARIRESNMDLHINMDSIISASEDLTQTTRWGHDDRSNNRWPLPEERSCLRLQIAACHSQDPWSWWPFLTTPGRLVLVVGSRGETDKPPADNTRSSSMQDLDVTSFTWRFSKIVSKDLGPLSIPVLLASNRSILPSREQAQADLHGNCVIPLLETTAHRVAM